MSVGSRNTPASQSPNDIRKARKRALRASTPSIVMTVDETAAYMRVSTQTIYDGCNAVPPRLPHIRQGKRILIIKPLLDQLIMKRARDAWGEGQEIQ